MHTWAGELAGTLPLLTRLSRALYRRATDAVLGMRLKEYIALNTLRDHSLTQQALGDWLHLDANNCVLLLNQLEAAGLAERRRDPDDRRRHIVRITPTGRQAVDRADRALESVEGAVLGALSREERAPLRHLLSRAIDGLPHERDARPSADQLHRP